MSKIISSTIASIVLIIGLYMACSGCGTDLHCDAEGNSGICIQYESYYVPPQVVDDALYLTWFEIRHTYGEHRKEYSERVLKGSQTTIKFVDDLIDCQYTKCTGTASLEDRVIKVTFPNEYFCIANTSLVHEFLHLIPHHIGLGSDGSHEDERRWVGIVGRVNNYLRAEYCNE